MSYTLRSTKSEGSVGSDTLIRMCSRSAVDFRLRALHRLYEQKELLDSVIESLEAYQRMKQPRAAECIPFESLTRCS